MYIDSVWAMAPARSRGWDLHFLEPVQRVLSRLPAEAGGIALNLAGLGSWLSALCELHPVLLPVYDAGAGVLAALAFLLVLGFLLQATLHSAHLIGELKKPKQCGSMGGLLMALSLCCSYLRFLSDGQLAACVLVHIAAEAQIRNRFVS